MLANIMIHSRNGESMDKSIDNATNGMSRNTNPCLSIALMVRTINGTLVIPMTALGFRSNALMR